MATSVPIKLLIEMVTELPATLELNKLYLLAGANNTFTMHVRSGSGTPTKRDMAALFQAFDRYDLGIQDTTGPMDISAKQWFRVNLGTAGAAITLTMTGTGSARGQVIVLQTLGNARSVVLPSNVVVPSGIDTTPGAISSIYTIVWDGATAQLISNARRD